MLGGPVTGTLIFGLFLISLFLLFNTGLKVPFLGKKKEVQVDADIESIDILSDGVKAVDITDNTENEESDEETSGLASVTQKISNFGKSKTGKFSLKTSVALTSLLPSIS